MRRMYSEKELTTIINQVVGEYIEAGGLDESIAAAVDAYLLENPIDITDLEELDISVGSLDADGLITGGEIVEKMSGYSLAKPTTDKGTFTYVYAGAVKHGNRLTLVNAFSFTKADGATGTVLSGRFMFPSAIGAKIYTFISANLVDVRKISVTPDGQSFIDIRSKWVKYDSDSLYSVFDLDLLTVGVEYFVRQEITILLSDNLAE